MLKPIRGKNTWCGPAAMSAITGFDTDYCANELTRITGREVIKGVWPSELCKALFRMGYHPIRMPDGDKPPTLSQWLRQPRDREDVYLVFITRHYIVVRGWEIIDNHTKVPVWHSKYHYQRKRVVATWKVVY
jgi:hypothetical protein